MRAGCLLGGVRQQSHGSGPFYGHRQLALMMRTVSGYTPGKNFPSFRNVTAKTGDLFIFYMLDLVGTEITLFAFLSPLFFQLSYLLGLERNLVFSFLIYVIDLVEV